MIDPLFQLSTFLTSFMSLICHKDGSKPIIRFNFMLKFGFATEINYLTASRDLIHSKVDSGVSLSRFQGQQA